MSRSLPVVAIVASVAALLVALLRAPRPEAASSAPTMAKPEPAFSNVELEEALAERDQKISALEWTVTHLVDRVAALEKAQKAGAPAAGAVAALPEEGLRQLQSLRGDVDALLTGEAIQTESGRKRLKELVGEVQNEVFAERVRERAAAREAATNERVSRFVQEARLSASQESDLRGLLDEESKKRHELLASGGTGDRRQAFEQMRALSQETTEQAKALLNDEQFSQFEAMRQEDRFGGRANRGERGGGRRTQRGE